MFEHIVVGFGVQGIGKINLGFVTRLIKFIFPNLTNPYILKLPFQRKMPCHNLIIGVVVFEPII